MGGQHQKGKETVPVEEIITSVLTVNLLSQNSSVSINRLLERFAVISNYSNNLTKVKGVIPRYLRSVLDNDRQAAMLPPTVKLLTLSEHLLYLAAAPEVAELIKSSRLVRVSPYWNKGRWVTRGRLGEGIKKVLGAAELPVLHKDGQLSYLIMTKAHK